MRTTGWGVHVVTMCAMVFACVPHEEGEQASATEALASTSTGGTSAGTSSDDGTSTDADPGASSEATTDASTSTGAEPEGTTSSGDATDSSGTAATDSTGGAGEAVCGDGVLGGDEECDDGPDNNDHAACTADCKVAYCGDSKTLLGKEACDEGDANGDGAYGGCTDLCQLGPHCGDKIHQPDHEECDPLDPELADGSKCIACTWNANLIFVSSATFSGDLGGLDGADQECQALAGAAKLPGAGAFKAWLSAGATSPKTRFVPAAVGAYILPNGVEIAGSWGELVSGKNLQSAVNVDETKVVVPKPHRVWSNTTSTGSGLEGPDCDGWTNGEIGASGSYGSIDALDASWTNAGMAWCSQHYRLYCVATAG